LNLDFDTLLSINGLNKEDMFLYHLLCVKDPVGEYMEFI